MKGEIENRKWRIENRDLQSILNPRIFCGLWFFVISFVFYAVLDRHFLAEPEIPSPASVGVRREAAS